MNETNWTALHPLHCRDDRCNGGATCSCPCHAEGYAGELDLPDMPDPNAERDKRIDDLEQQVGELIERVDLLQQGGAGLTEIVGQMIAIMTEHEPSGPVDVALSPRLAEDVPQNVRLGEDRPGGRKL